MIEELTLGGFKSYGRRQTVRFTRGVNKISGRNASGKTTLLEAVLFGLFGDVPGVDSRDLIPLGGGKLYVSVVFRSPYTDRRVTVVREGSMVARRRGDTAEEGFRTSTLYMEVEGEEKPYTREREIQGKLRELLGVGRRTFFNVVYAKQKEFVEILNPRQVRMDAILGLTTPAEMREQLREVRRELEARGRIHEKGAIEERIRNAEAAIAEGRQQLEEVEARRKDLSERAGKLRAELEALLGRGKAVEALAADFRKLEGGRTELEVLRGRRRERENDLVGLYQAIGDQPERHLAELQERRRTSVELEERLGRIVEEDLGQERRALDGDVSRLNHQIGEHLELKEQGVAVCPKCGQRVDHELLEEDLRRWRAELEEKRARVEDLDMELRATQAQMRTARERRIEAERAISRLAEQLKRIDELREITRRLFEESQILARRLEAENEALRIRAEAEMDASFGTAAEAQKAVEERLGLIQKERASVQADVRSAEALLAEAERRRAEAERRLEAQQEALQDSRELLGRILEYEAKIGAVERIVERYGEYERRLRDSTLKLLEWLTYKYFQRLTDQDVYSACHIDRESYVLEVQPLKSSRLLPAWRAGGGHESLLALSERLALLRVRGFPHLLILDEPTDAVDSENIPQLLEYIARSSREIGQVLLVTHHGHGEEEGVNLITVRKVDGESRVTQEAPRPAGAD
ncbi:hypothetical protein AC482_05325 [miscellaneous Crenarchaeota group-15 archaeon DG-45]|uniref:Rad50/SbcC-type AAA domain-containing protein n=1 Tax=miscellaneous Crenarchaeota group-15 archaeon DG-45 TaxID=1685127 RepID=A0A0M0BNC4_9ARCH|nr:MAG: hypothetical protein AC482_05325 [miscellaneous Crenarchaeota group-15 archaeon DG-45]